MDKVKFLKGLSAKQALLLKFVIAFVLLAIFIGGSYNYVSGKRAMLRAKEREFGEFSRLMKKFSTGREIIRPVKKRLASPGPTASPVTVMEEIGTELGIKDNLKSFKAVEESIEDGYVIKSVEVAVKGITLNQFVNLIYEIDRYPGLILVQEMELKTGFENNKELDCSLKVLLISKTAS